MAFTQAISPLTSITLHYSIDYNRTCFDTVIWAVEVANSAIKPSIAIAICLGWWRIKDEATQHDGGCNQNCFFHNFFVLVIRYFTNQSF